MFGILFGVGDRHIDRVAGIITHYFVTRIDKSLIGCYREVGVAVEDLIVELWVDFHCVFFDECFTRLVVTFALDALYFSEQFSEQSAQGFVIVDREHGLAVDLVE